MSARPRVPASPGHGDLARTVALHEPLDLNAAEHAGCGRCLLIRRKRQVAIHGRHARIGLNKDVACRSKRDRSSAARGKISVRVRKRDANGGTRRCCVQFFRRRYVDWRVERDAAGRRERQILIGSRCRIKCDAAAGRLDGGRSTADRQGVGRRGTEADRATRSEGQAIQRDAFVERRTATININILVERRQPCACILCDTGRFGRATDRAIEGDPTSTGQCQRISTVDRAVDCQRLAAGIRIERTAARAKGDTAVNIQRHIVGCRSQCAAGEREIRRWCSRCRAEIAIRADRKHTTIDGCTTGVRVAGIGQR